jgi:hypothetical protein
MQNRRADCGVRFWRLAVAATPRQGKRRWRLFRETPKAVRALRKLRQEDALWPN